MAAAITQRMPHNYHNYLLKPLLGSLAVAICFITASAYATRPVTLAWDRSSASDTAGYNLFYGTTSGNYSLVVNAGNATSVTISGLNENTTYFVVVTAYNGAGLQSLPSSEISFTTPTNLPPTVRLTSPQQGASLDGTNPITITANASDADGTITKVEFYADSTMVGQSAAAPFSASWSNASSGNHLLTALAYDDNGAAVRSTGVSVDIGGPGAGPNPSPSATPLPKVHVIAQTPTVRAGATGRFRVATNRVDFSQATTVNYTMSGTASSGVDYALGSATGQTTIPAGARAVTIFLNTVGGSMTEKKTAVVNLTSSAAYRASQQSATIVIHP